MVWPRAAKNVDKEDGEEGRPLRRRSRGRFKTTWEGQAQTDINGLEVQNWRRVGENREERNYILRIAT